METSDADKALLKDFGQRFSRAQTEKSKVNPRFSDIYRLTMPQRHAQDGTTPEDSLDEIFDSTPLYALADFASDILGAFTPPHTSEWVRLEPTEQFNGDAADRKLLEEQIASYKRVLWQAISDSNLTSALRECYRDLAVGTMALLIQDTHPAAPIECTCVPISDLYLDRGPGGCVDGRFRRAKLRADLVEVMWPGATLPPGLRNSAAEIDVTEGMWRVWSEKGKEVWQFALVSGPEILLQGRYEGEGACPLLVARWDTDAATSWGFGPLYQALADIKTLNKAAELVLRNADKAVDPPTTYDDDGVIDVAQGVSAGDWIPRMPGSKIDVLDTGANFQIGFFIKDDLQRAIKRALFQDHPEQAGKTPPTATQWLDQAQQTARRMGAPAGALVEWQFAIIRRFAYLLAERGTLPKVQFGNGSLVHLRPTSPLVRSGDQEKGRRLQAVVAELTQLFGAQQAALLVDAAVYADVRAHEEALTDTKVFRSPQQVQQMVQQGMQMAQQAGALPGQPGGQGA